MNNLYYENQQLPDLDDLDYMSGTASPFTAKADKEDIVEMNPFVFDKKALAESLVAIYHKDYDPGHDISSEFYNEVMRILTDAADKGMADSRTDLPEAFRQKVAQGSAVFSAFKVHRMQNDIATQLYDSNGVLKPFKQWNEDVYPMLDHHVGHWLRTEYNTACLRAQQAADWQRFEQYADTLPNLEWMPSTSIHPGADHKDFWGTILPMNHPFWSAHRPGDRWNCKCSLSATDEPPTGAPKESSDPKNQPAPGLDNNPGRDGRLFSDTHPYIANGYEGAKSAATDMLRPGFEKGFTPAKDMEEAVKRLNGHGVKEVTVGGATLEYINIALEVIQKESGKTGIDLNRLVMADKATMAKIGHKEADGLFNPDKKLLYVRVDSFRHSLYSPLVTHQEALSRHKDVLSSLQYDIERTKERMKTATGSFKKMLKEDVTKMQQNIWEIEKKMYHREQALKKGEDPLYQVTTQQYKKISDQLKNVLYHEMGHNADWKMDEVSKKINVKAASQYGAKMNSENFAEWYATYRMNGKAGIPKEMLEAFEKYDKKLLSDKQ